MSARYYYGLSLAIAASISLLTGGCGSDRAATRAADPAASQAAAARMAASEPDNSDATLWTVLGLAKRQSERTPGPMTGGTVSPVLWQAAHEALEFAGFASEDPVTGLLVTNWYSPPAKPHERLRVSVFILSRALRSDSVSVMVERQERSRSGEWGDTPIARDVVAGLENAILLRARQLHAERYRSTMYN